MEAGPGWVTAARVAQGSGGSGGSGSGSGSGSAGQDVSLGREGTLGGDFGQGGSGTGQKGEGIDAWFAVEPEGAIMLHLNFGTFDRLSNLISPFW